MVAEDTRSGCGDWRLSRRMVRICLVRSGSILITSLTMVHLVITAQCGSSGVPGEGFSPAWPRSIRPKPCLSELFSPPFYRKTVHSANTISFLNKFFLNYPFLIHIKPCRSAKAMLPPPSIHPFLARVEKENLISSLGYVCHPHHLRYQAVV